MSNALGDDPVTTLPDAIRTHPRFEAIHRAREQVAANARAHQARYRCLNRGVILFTALAAVFGGLLLYGLDTRPPGDPVEGPRLKQFVTDPDVRIALAVIQALALAAAAGCGYLLSQLHHDDRWIENRMKAESGRIDRALAALELGHAAGSEAFRAGARYFAAELIDGQLTYLQNAVRRHEERASTLAVIGASIAAIGALAVGLGGTGVSALLLFAALVGVVSPTFISALKSWEQSSADQERAQLHADTWDTLNTLSGERTVLDEAVAANDLEAARAYAARVVSVQRSDHETFEKLRKSAGVTPPDRCSS